MTRVLKVGIAAIWLAAHMIGQTPEAASLDGRVVDAAGFPLAGVSVIALDAAGQTRGSTTTKESGLWHIQVPPGPYRLKFHAGGFAEGTMDAVQSPGSAGTLTLVRPSAQGSTSENEVQTVRYRPVVDTERTYQADFITARQLMKLPVNRRNYLSLAALTPGVAEVNDYVGLTDAPLVQAPQSGLSFGGNNGRGNIFWLDGGENYINTGGVRPSVSQEAVAEFQVTRSNYSAEFGGGIGGIVNIVSKSGNNGIHGDVFGFLNHSALNARNYFDPRKQAFTRSQTGATIGGPLRKDRTYYFFSFERLQREQSAFVVIGGDRGSFRRLRKTQDDIANFLLAGVNPQLGALTRNLLLTTNFPLTLALFDNNRGVFPFSESNTQGSVRIDRRFSDNHNAFLRFNASAGFNQNSQVEGFTAYSRALVTDFSDQTLMLNDTYVVSERLVSESRLSFNRTRFNSSNRDRIGPSIDINGYGLFGKDSTLPTDFGEWHGQLQQNFFYASGRHSLRFGVDINPVRGAAILQTNIGGRFSFGEYLPLGALYNTLTQSPDTYASLASVLAKNAPALARALDIPLTAIQAFNLGIPAFYIQGFGNPSWKGWFHRYNFFANDVIRVNPRLTLNAGLRYELESAPSGLGTDPNNLGPRAALAWDVQGNKRSVIRAGYGIFYLRHQNQLSAAIDTQSGKSYNQIVVPLTGLPGTRNPLTGQPINSADVYQTLLQEGVIGRRAITPGDLAQFGIVVGPNFPFQALFEKPRNFVHAYSQQTSFEVERAVGDVSVLLGYSFIRAAHLPRLRDLNVAHGPPGALGLPTLVPADPLVAQRLVFESAANSFYHAMFVQVARRFSPRLTLNAHYTLSKSIDESTDINFLPNDSLNARADRGLSTFDQRHRVVASAVIDLPGSSHGAGAIFRGSTLSPIFAFSSGRPFNVVTGLDFNSQRPAGAGRNIGHGPDFASLDARFSREFAILGSERTKLEFIAEGFNLMNRTNFRRINNTVGLVTVDQLPRPLEGVRGDPTNALSFTSAFDARQLQIALKLRW